MRERDDPEAPTLRYPLDPGREAATDEDGARVEVDVVPAQTESLALAQADR